MLHMKTKISGCVITYNEEHNIERCLKSMIQIVDEIIIYDSKSNDNTVDIAKKYTDKIFITDWPGYGEQRNRAISQCKYDWILFIDADEVLSDKLVNELYNISLDDMDKYNIYYFKWNTYFYGKLLKHGRFSKPQHKLFNKTNVMYKMRSCHETLNITNNNTKKIVLKNPLIHYSWKDYKNFQDKYINYSLLLANEKFKASDNTGCYYMVIAIFRFFFDFIREFFFNGSFLDGWFGFIISFNLAVYAFNKYVNLYLLNIKQK